MDVEHAIRTRRTHKVFAPEPVDPATLHELLELARWAPNHHLTEPWRFRVLGPRSLAALKDAAGAEAAAKLDRAPTLVVATARRTAEDPIGDQEDAYATACGVYIVLLAAHARGLVGYWRTPEVLRGASGRAAVGVGEGERVLGLIHLGHPRQDRSAPARAPAADYVTYLP